MTPPTHAERDRADAAAAKARLASAEEPRTLIFPLQGGREISVTIPVPITLAEFEFFVEFVNLMKRVLGVELIPPPPPPPPP